jgi:hypothetical protein
MNSDRMQNEPDAKEIRKTKLRFMKRIKVMKLEGGMKTTNRCPSLFSTVVNTATRMFSVKY